ncbi:hypothetical protein SKAU_G00276530 [Synaphobranchus kaupii]|uniref:Uncharacterized protein n=1 Tax=Synaphobranchus kaupii TaxID=118154 RepID=A0A9Q1IR40_SYNKA|nr:hypothetical protein SKAU_G00276530 [Synaphobranchus kaupii]
MATEQPAGSTEIQYPVEVTNAQSRKQYKLSLLKSSPESLYCDYAHIEDRKIKNNLIFHTEHPTAWLCPPKYMEQMRETLALLEQDFTEFWELTMARLCEQSLSQQLRDEVCQVKRECRMALSEAMAELKELQEDMKLLEPSWPALKRT